MADDDATAEGLTEDAAFNRAVWDGYSDEYQAKHGEELAASGGLAWGTTRISEADLQVLGEVAGRDILELGCGAAQWSIALAKRGARPVGLDLSERQLAHARRLMADAGVDFPLIHASAELVPLPDASFDIVFCDHGAMTFADPYRSVPEVARLLRPGGLFAFNHHTPIETICWPLDAETVGEQLAWTTSTCTASTMARRSRSSCPTASGSACSARMASRSRTSSSRDPRRTRPARTVRPPSWPGRGAGRPRRSGGCVAGDRGVRVRPRARGRSRVVDGRAGPAGRPDVSPG